MKSDLSKVKVGDKIWTIETGWEEVIDKGYSRNYPIKTPSNSYTFDGKISDEYKYPSAFLEYPFKEQPIEKDTLVWFRDGEDENWMVGYYSHIEDEVHRCFIESKKSTETDLTAAWYIVTTENPLS
jgi:hypothetical protein